MPNSLEISSFKVFLACLYLFARHCFADLTYVDPTTSCTSQSVAGEAIYCCDGGCFDGTNIFNKYGLCKNFDDSCNDPANPPSCATSQVYTSTADTIVDSGIGLCYIPITGCMWSNDVYTYSCCDCPAGYVGYMSNCGGPISRYSSFCVGCTEDSETLQYDPSSQTYTCDGLPVPCSVANAVSKSTSILSLVSTWAGSLCSAADFSSVAFTLLNDAYTIAVDAEDSSSGPLGNNVAALSAVAATILVFSGAGEALGIAAALGETFEAACLWNTFFGPALTLAGQVETAYINNYCANSVSKRSISSGASGRFISESISAFSRRDNAYNPCLELVGMFPTDYSTPAAADSACDEIQSYNATHMGDEGMANATTSLQQVCTAYQGSGNSTLMMDFASMLSALSDAIPYCTNATNSSAATSSYGVSSTTTTSLFSSLASAASPSGRTTTLDTTSSSETSSSVKPTTSSSISRSRPSGLSRTMSTGYYTTTSKTSIVASPIFSSSSLSLTKLSTTVISSLPLRSVSTSSSIRASLSGSNIRSSTASSSSTSRSSTTYEPTSSATATHSLSSSSSLYRTSSTKSKSTLTQKASSKVSSSLATTSSITSKFSSTTGTTRTGSQTISRSTTVSATTAKDSTSLRSSSTISKRATSSQTTRTSSSNIQTRPRSTTSSLISRRSSTSSSHSTTPSSKISTATTKKATTSPSSPHTTSKTTTLSHTTSKTSNNVQTSSRSINSSPSSTKSAVSSGSTKTTIKSTTLSSHTTTTSSSKTRSSPSP
jgi:hypothetical protein